MSRIFNDDCLNIMKRIKSQSIDLIVTDPPYLINYKTCHRKDKTHQFCTVIQNDNNPELITNYIKQCYRIMKNDTAMYMFCNCDKVDFFKQQLQKYFKMKNMIIWVKNNWTAGDLKAQFGKQYQIIFLVNKGRKCFNGKRHTDVWMFDRVVGKNQLHQNQKPTQLLDRCILSHSNQNDIVFDGFMGSGSTIISCIQNNRKYIGVQLDENYFNIAKERIEKINVTF